MELDDMGGVNEPVADRVGERGLTDHVVPGLDGELTGDEGRRAFGAILEDLEQIVALGRGERHQAPVVDHEQLGLGQPGEQARVGAVAARDVEVVKQARGPGAVGRVAGAAGALSEGFGEPRAAGPGGPEEEEVAMLGDPGARRQGMKLGLIEPPPRAVPVECAVTAIAGMLPPLSDFSRRSCSTSQSPSSAGIARSEMIAFRRTVLIMVSASRAVRALRTLAPHCSSAALKSSSVSL